MNSSGGASNGSWIGKAAAATYDDDFCVEYIRNVTTLADALDSSYPPKNVTVDERRTFHDLVVNVATPAICLFGIVGNVLNLVVLSRKRLQRSMDRMERSVHLGLVALAVSDLLFCSFYLLTSVVPERAKYSPYDSLAALYFKVTVIFGDD